MKNIGLKILGFIKNHHIISCILLIILLFQTANFIRYTYNRIKYGKFVKVAQKYSDYEYSGFASAGYLYPEIDENSFLFFIIPMARKPIPYNDITDFYNIDGFSFFYYSNKYMDSNEPLVFFEMYDKFYDEFIYTKLPYIISYKLNKKRKKLEQIDHSWGIIKDKKFSPVLKITDDYTIYIKNNKKSDFKIDGNGGRIKPYRIDKDTFLISLHSYYENSFKSSFLFSYKDMKLSHIDTSEIPQNDFCNTALIQLEGNKFLTLSNYKKTGYLTDISFYEFKNNKFHKLQFEPPKNYEKFSFSLDYPFVLDKNAVLFIGGSIGEYDLTKTTERCYLFDIEKNKIVRINDIKFEMNDYSEVKTIKTLGGNYYIHFIDKNYFDNKHYFYEYIR